MNKTPSFQEHHRDLGMGKTISFVGKEGDILGHRTCWVWARQVVSVARLHCLVDGLYLNTSAVSTVSSFTVHRTTAPTAGMAE